MAFHISAECLEDSCRRQVIWVDPHASVEAVKPATLQIRSAQAGDPSFHLGCSQCCLQGCFTSNEHNENKASWAEHRQAGPDVASQLSPSLGTSRGGEVGGHAPGVT